jgi:hypothetical protein
MRGNSDLRANASTRTPCTLDAYTQLHHLHTGDPTSYGTASPTLRDGTVTAPRTLPRAPCCHCCLQETRRYEVGTTKLLQSP